MTFPYHIIDGMPNGALHVPAQMMLLANSVIAVDKCCHLLTGSDDTSAV